MPTRHIVFDELVLLWDAVATTAWTVGLEYSSDVDLQALGIDAQSYKHYGIAISWPGVGSAGAATTELRMFSGAAATPTGLIYTGPATLSLAATKAKYQDAERCVIPIPLLDCLRYFRIGINVAGATINAGAITAGIIPLEGGG